ncbi:ac91fe1d-6c14-4931-95dc-02791d6b805e [Thermothielavioides terrestris]|uniref:Ac91fe1d-6c14-4931-95dc-02791d6b805e n=1 Tax=Thermothielavioides terrestris TaxID=2587410 RepID=A0A446BID1_9PEZI|nr:ac91fe1d-6c14-4931-95dc-02791d6b805e [Thermothielavioides terrestris]
MSLRGFQKGIARAPQQLKAKLNIGEHTKDPVYIDTERRFQDLEAETKHLHDESKKYFDAINGMLSHQIEFSKAMTEIYKPISGRMSDPESLKLQGNLEGIRACEEYEAVVKDLQETLAPELEMIESRVIRPATELLDVIKVIRKTATKREHKKLDYDRHRATLKKLQEKKDRSAKDEKALWKAENDVEQSTQEYNYYNDLLKDELPKLFALEREFIQPLFQSFYYMQLNIFYTLHERMQRVDIGYFDLTLDVEEAFQKKRGDVQERVEALSIVRFKTSGMKRPPKYGGPRPGAIEGPKTAGLLTPGTAATTPGANSTSAPATPALAAAPRSPSPAAAASFSKSPSATASSLRPSWQPRQADVIDNPPPPYSPQPQQPHAGSVSPAASLSAVAKAKPPPPPPPKPSRLSGAPKPETVTALYDYAAQAEGDLSFRAGDVIEVVTRTANENEWWTGRLGGRQGQFPGNYVRLNT